MKKCCICAQEKPLAEFYKDKWKPDGVTSSCQPCNVGRKKAWRSANRSEVVRYERIYRVENRANESRRTREWKRANPGHTASYRGKRLGAAGAGFGAADIRRLLGLQKSRCAACRADIKHRRHVDHIVPLALGGENSPRNLQLLCPSCNLSKWKLRPEEFMQRRGMLL